MNDNFPEHIPPLFRRLIAQGHTAIERQVRRTEAEEVVQPEELADPIGDDHFSPVKGITHRYRNRVLFKPYMSCALHCRFCFRRHTVGSSHLSPDETEAALEYISTRSEIGEVILTGGDPLLLETPVLARIFERLAALDHVKVLRIHSRVPVARPLRIDDELAEALGRIDKVVWLVVHTNCAAELGPEARQALTRLRRRGVPLLSQSVLLSGVNDSEEALGSLFSELVSLGVKPYYLHYPDLVQGTSHFRVPLERAIELVQALSDRISGTAIPRLCVDLPQGLGKVFPASTPCHRTPDGAWQFPSPLTGETVTVRYPAKNT